MRTSARQFDPTRRLAWVLLTLCACEKTGLSPISVRTFHRLTYFTNCLANVYGTQPPIELVLKQAWGPYYPNAQFDLDQLVLMGLADVENLDWEKGRAGTWKLGDYAISSHGFDMARSFVASGEWFEESQKFLLDLCHAFASVDDSMLDTVAERDLTYTQSGYVTGAVISFREDVRNFSARGARAFSDEAPIGATPNRQQQLRLYMKYLEGRAA